MTNQATQSLELSHLFPSICHPHPYFLSYTASPLTSAFCHEHLFSFWLQGFSSCSSAAFKAFSSFFSCLNLIHSLGLNSGAIFPRHPWSVLVAPLLPFHHILHIIPLAIIPLITLQLCVSPVGLMCQGLYHLTIAMTLGKSWNHCMSQFLYLQNRDNNNCCFFRLLPGLNELE